MRAWRQREFACIEHLCSTMMREGKLVSCDTSRLTKRLWRLEQLIYGSTKRAYDRYDCNHARAKPGEHKRLHSRGEQARVTRLAITIRG